MYPLCIDSQQLVTAHSAPAKMYIARPSASTYAFSTGILNLSFFITCPGCSTSLFSKLTSPNGNVAAIALKAALGDRDADHRALGPLSQHGGVDHAARRPFAAAGGWHVARIERPACAAAETIPSARSSARIGASQEAALLSLHRGCIAELRLPVTAAVRPASPPKSSGPDRPSPCPRRRYPPPGL
jgi:hypothetical protein